MLGINMSDVLNILNTCKAYLIALGIVILLAVVITIAVGLCKMNRSIRKLVQAQSWIAVLLAFIIIVNLICFGPMYTIISLAMGNGTIAEETLEAAKLVGENIADEGIVLAKNEGSLLPLSSTPKINVFGWSSTNPCYGGSGSGAMNDNYERIDLLTGLANAGFEPNKELSDFYTAYRADRPLMDPYGAGIVDWTIPEPPVSTYPSELISNAKAYSDVAVIVISRVGGEGLDIPIDMSTVTCEPNTTEYADYAPGSHYLELCQSEKDMIGMVCSNFDDVVVIYNGANTLEMGFVNEYEQIKSVLICPGPGQTGFNSLGRVLSGDVNPSAKTADTFVFDLTNTPTWNNFGSFAYDNMDEYAVDLWGSRAVPTFINYSEGLYVGYRYYETADDEGTIQYDDEVVFPFGYGLSYTTFSQTMSDLSVAGGNITFDVTVTNTGNVAGKDVVEVYFNPPYTNGGIEKSSVNLVAYDKTKLLAPGESDVVTISFREEDLASYDDRNERAWVLDAGDYIISINSDAHTVIDEQTYTVSSRIVYNGSNKRSTDLIAVTNVFDNARGDVVYLSRADHFANYDEATRAPVSKSMSDENKAKFLNNTNYDPADYSNSNDSMPLTGQKNGLQLSEMRGLEYDDPKWETLLDQLTVTEMNEMVAMGGFQTAAAKSVGKVATTDCDGPAAINNNFTGVGSIGFPSAIMLACTWNDDLAYAFGDSIGTMANEMNVSGWYAPAMNTHRSAFGGRNFEYYSEDGVLAGGMAMNAESGAYAHGVYGYIKHFALNEQETNRQSMLCTWISEQAVREIYLKPFERCVKEGNATAVMSAYNYIGGEYAGAHHGLLQTILRDEWGFHGLVLTDFFGGMGFQDSDQIIRNGGDTCLATYDTGSNYLHDTSSATAVLMMRRAAKNIMYTVVNSREYEGEVLNQGMQPWQITAIVIDIVLACGVAALEIWTVRNYLKKKDHPQSAKTA